MKVGSLFSGIGGFDFGLERAGMQVVWQSEIEPYCCDVLKKHRPEVPNLGDIFKIKDPPAVDLICGGFPCQPFSVAGKRQGKADDRYIWPEMLRVIQNVRPAWIIGENVIGSIDMALDDWCADLEHAGYEVQPFDISAACAGLPTMERHVWIIAAAPCIGLKGIKTIKNSINREKGELQGTDSRLFERRVISETRFCRVGERVSHRLDRNQRLRLKALGNAIVPAIAEEIGRMIMEIDQRLAQGVLKLETKT